MTTIAFVKLHASGNDFMLVDNTRQGIEFNRQQIQAWSERHTGIGFDQLLVIDRKPAVMTYRIFNADGSEAKQCGNGLRAVAHYLRLQQAQSFVDGSSLRVQTNSSEVGVSCQGHEYLVDMGVPSVLSEEAGLGALPDWPYYFIAIGNHHLVVRVTDLENLDLIEWVQHFQSEYPAWQTPVNIEFIQPVATDKILARVYEHGVGETLACGSGACAIAVAAQKKRQAALTYCIIMPGGELKVRWEGEGQPVQLLGDAHLVYNGQIDTNLALDLQFNVGKH